MKDNAKNNTTELVFILDKSGSMAGLESDTVGGFNAMIEKQKKSGGKCIVSTVLFSNNSTVIHDRVDINEIAPMTTNDYVVGGGTALLDAVGNAIIHIVNVHRYARPEDVPDHTIVVIITDGIENASVEFNRLKVTKLIKLNQRIYGWEFLFFGANIDAVNEAARMGIRQERAASWLNTGMGAGRLYEVIGYAVNNIAMEKTNQLDDEKWKERLKDDKDN